MHNLPNRGCDVPGEERACSVLSVETNFWPYSLRLNSRIWSVCWPRSPWMGSCLLSFQLCVWSKRFCKQRKVSICYLHLVILMHACTKTLGSPKSEEEMHKQKASFPSTYFDTLHSGRMNVHGLRSPRWGVCRDGWSLFIFGNRYSTKKKKKVGWATTRGWAMTLDIMVLVL